MATKKKPAMPCDCADQVNEQLKERGAALVRHIQFDFGRKSASLSPPVITLQKTGKSRKRLMTLYAAHCPFCGKKYPE